MSETKIEYEILTFPSSENYQIFRVFGQTIYQIICPRAYYIGDTQEWDYFDLIFNDPVTAEIISEYLNEAEEELNG